MALENINITYPNFCLGPQVGTFGTINTSDPTTIFRIKNSSGGVINDYTLSANITSGNSIIGLEYVGPKNLSGPIDEITFFTLERVSSTKCIISRWELNTTFSLLSLKQQIIKYTTGNYHYDAVGMAVEHYNRSFDFSQPAGQNYLEINNASRIQNGDVLFLGPSTDTDNLGATEKISVSYVSGNKVYLNGSTTYQYAFGDNINFFNNIYLITGIGYGGDTRYGSIYKIGAYSGSVLEYTTSGEYKNISGGCWCNSVSAIAGINESQLLFIRPYDSYLKWKSMFLNNISSNEYSQFEIYDIVFDDITLYKLAKYTTRKDDIGNKTTYSWTNYNYQQDTLLPYTHHVALYTKQQRVSGQDETQLYAVTRDQFGVALRDVNLNFYDDGSDDAAAFDPLNGQGITDANGKFDLKYISGGNYTGPTTISVRADKSSSFTGSEYCWNYVLLDSTVKIVSGFGRGALFLDFNHSEQLYAWQIYDPFQVVAPKRASIGTELTVPRAYLICKSIFETPGGDWIEGGAYNQGCWPWFQITGGRNDGPNSEFGGGCRWNCIPYDPNEGTYEEGMNSCPNDFRPRPHFIKQVLAFTQRDVPSTYYENPTPPTDSINNKTTGAMGIPQVIDYWLYDDGGALEDGEPVSHRLFQFDRTNEMFFSQLNLSKHTHYVDGQPVDELFTNVRLDQFIFVQDAVPSFWSEKNPRNTYVWIRLRPFAFSLDPTTLKFYVREVWSEGDLHYDTGYYELGDLYGPMTDFNDPNDPTAGCTSSNPICYRTFDAGGGALGLEFLYNPPEQFHHNALVYIHIEIFDTAAEPNYIYTDYWFRVIPDYNSPYIFNLDPDREETQVALDTDIYFEIKDDGHGVDIETLEVFINSRRIKPQYITALKVSNYHYKVLCNLPDNLLYDKVYSIGVKCSDLSPNDNVLRDSYRFYTRASEAPWFTGFDPKLCKRGMPLFRDVSFMVLASGDGVDKDTIRIQVHDKDVTEKSKILPIIYRIS